MSSVKITIIDNHSSPLNPTDSGGNHLIIDDDEIKIFEYENQEEDVNTDRLSPVIKEEEEEGEEPSSTNSSGNQSECFFPIKDRRNPDQQCQHFVPYFISPYYQTNHSIPSVDKISSLESLSKFISPSPTHRSNSNDHHTDISNPIYSSPHWCSPMFSSDYSIPRVVPHSRRELKQKNSHIKKPLNAFMLFMREQRAQVVQECTLRESAAVNQILGRKWHELERNVQQKYYDMARDERLKHMELYPGWSARDNYGVKKNRIDQGKKREKNQECLNQKKCRARFGLEQQINWCKHCKRKKKCLRYTENETRSLDVSSWSDEDDTDHIDDSNDCDVIPSMEQLLPERIAIDSDEENKLRLLKYRQISNRNEPAISMTMKDLPSFHSHRFLPGTSSPLLNEFKREI